MSPISSPNLFESLPIELNYLIFNELEPLEQMKLRGTCRVFKEIVENNLRHAIETIDLPNVSLAACQNQKPDATTLVDFSEPEKALYQQISPGKDGLTFSSLNKVITLSKDVHQQNWINYIIKHLAFDIYRNQKRPTALPIGLAMNTQIVSLLLDLLSRYKGIDSVKFNLHIPDGGEKFPLLNSALSKCEHIKTIVFSNQLYKAVNWTKYLKQSLIAMTNLQNLEFLNGNFTDFDAFTLAEIISERQKQTKVKLTSLIIKGVNRITAIGFEAIIRAAKSQNPPLSLRFDAHSLVFNPSRSSSLSKLSVKSKLINTK
jgi:hypothetical protein